VSLEEDIKYSFMGYLTEGIPPGEAVFFDCDGNDGLCISSVAGVCLRCAAPWVHCGCGKYDLDCICGACAESSEMAECPHCGARL